MRGDVRQPWPTKNGIGEKCLSLYSLLILIIPESGEFAEKFILKELFFNPKQAHVANMQKSFSRHALLHIFLSQGL
jgi:hypothetical protein